MITSDPPGLPVRFDNEPAGNTPVKVEESEAFATHTVVVGEGPAAVTEIVQANRIGAKSFTTGMIMPVGCLLIFPFYWTAGTDDRVHVATQLSGSAIAPPDEPEWGYLSEDEMVPNGVRVDKLIVDGKAVRVVVDRRDFITSINYQGLSIPMKQVFVRPAGTRLNIKPPILSTGVEQEWRPDYRWGVGAGFSYGAFQRGLDKGLLLNRNYADFSTAPAFGYDAYRVGMLLRYHQPVLHWDGLTGGADLIAGAGVDAVWHTYYGPLKTIRTQVKPSPWVELGVDIAFTRFVSAFITDRVLPFALPAPGGVWGNLDSTPEQRVILGARFYW